MVHHQLKFSSVLALNLCVHMQYTSLSTLLGHLKTINFPLETNEKLIVYGVPILTVFLRL